MKTLSGEGGSLASNERLGGLEAGVADIVPLMEVDANLLVKSNIWQNTALEPSTSTPS